MLEKAARTLYLNKTCYNGLYRVNSKGQFNSPFGNYANPNIVNADGLRTVSGYFNSAKVSLTSADYADVLGTLPKGTFVYLDPPYDSISGITSFTGYTKSGFSQNEQVRLYENCNNLNRRGIKFMLSNSATDFIKALYANYNITIVEARRTINSKGNRRGKIPELIIRNY
jgi:DNA adenine methylase